MPEFPTAYVHRLDGQPIVPPRRWVLPGAGLLRVVIGLWPATVTVLVAATLVVTNAL
ncbi:MAG TPA: hypothetical protein VGM90_41410 [Kofleriaceae bacterium]|jgi:hypothetical protein